MWSVAFGEFPKRFVTHIENPKYFILRIYMFWTKLRGIKTTRCNHAPLNCESALADVTFVPMSHFGYWNVDMGGGMRGTLQILGPI